MPIVKPMRISLLTLLTGFFFALNGVVIGAAPVNVEQYRDINPVIVIFARTADEPAMFAFNLALSTEWNRIEARQIRTVDVAPGRYDLDGVAEQLGIQGLDFAIVVIGLNGEIIHRTEDPDSLSRILMILDQELHRDNNSLSREDP